MVNDADNSQFQKKYGSWALITGAAQGLGEAFAEGVAVRGLNILMVDKNAEQLNTTADRIRGSCAVEVRAIECDLSSSEFLDVLARETASLEVGLLICNAAVGTTARFLDLNPDDINLHISVNCRSSALLTRHFAQRMTSLERGGIILIGSASGLQGSPMFSVYAATKAFEMVLAESLWYELRPAGIDVVSFIPGPTNTPGLRSSNPALKEGQATDTVGLPQATAEKALLSLGSGPAVARDAPVQSRLAGRKASITAMGDRFFK